MGRRLRLSRIDGHVCHGDRWQAWFLLPPQRWSYRSMAEQEALIKANAVMYSQLAGRRIHLRVTARPYAVDEWGEALDRNTPNPLGGRTPGPSGRSQWAEHQRAEQLHALGLALTDKQVYLGVELLAPRYRRKDVAQELDDLAGFIAAPGVDGRPVTPGEFEYLRHRSINLGTPAPTDLPPPMTVWTVDDLAGEEVGWSQKPGDPTVLIEPGRHVRVLTLSRMQDLWIPEQSAPWMQRIEQLGAFEWSITADIQRQEVTLSRARDLLKRARSQAEHYTVDHREDQPEALVRQKAQALGMEDDAGREDPLAIRADVWVRVAVSGVTEQDTVAKAKRVADLYTPQLTFTAGADQYRRAREFIPGEPLSSTAHRRMMTVATIAAGLPQVTEMVGDRSGIQIGKTEKGMVCWDTHRSMEVRERPGLTIVFGSLGSGKSVAVGSITYQTCMRGIPCRILDPAGRLNRLTEVPQLAPYSRAIDLMNAEPGVLNPYQVISDPKIENCATPEEYADADKMAHARRRNLCLDVLTMLLPESVADDPRTRYHLMDAIRAVGGSRRSSPRQIIERLNAGDDWAKYVARELEEMADMPQARLFFPKNWDIDREPAEREWILEVLTMRGLVLPNQAKPKKDWMIEERLGVPLLHLAAHLTAQHIYDRNRHMRKLVVLDEMWALTSVPSGKSLVNDMVRNSRAWNLRLLLCSQLPADALSLDIEGLIDSALAGRTLGFKNQQDGLRVLGVETDAGYEPKLGALSPVERLTDIRSGYREFLFSDGDGGVEKIRFHVPAAVREYLDTTADPSKARVLA